MTVRRPSLAPHLGQTVQVSAIIDHGEPALGAAGQRRDDATALCLADLTVNGENHPDIDHLWIAVGETATRRLESLVPGWPHLPPRARRRRVLTLEFECDVVYYTSARGPSYGLEHPRAVRLHLDGQWRTLAMRSEDVYAQGSTGPGLRRIREELDHERQREVMLRASRLPRRDRSIQQALQAYFVRKQPLSDRQFKHVVRALGA